MKDFQDYWDANNKRYPTEIIAKLASKVQGKLQKVFDTVLPGDTESAHREITDVYEIKQIHKSANNIRLIGIHYESTEVYQKIYLYLQLNAFNNIPDKTVKKIATSLDNIITNFGFEMTVDRGPFDRVYMIANVEPLYNRFKDEIDIQTGWF